MVTIFKKGSMDFLNVLSRMFILMFVLLVLVYPPPLSFVKENARHFATFIRNLGIRREFKDLLEVLFPLTGFCTFGAIFFKPCWMVLLLFVIVSRGIYLLEPAVFAYRNKDFSLTMDYILNDDKGTILTTLSLIAVMLHAGTINRS